MKDGLTWELKKRPPWSTRRSVPLPKKLVGTKPRCDPKFEGTKLEDLRRERDRWKKRAEEKQRLRGKKEEAWELFQRQPRLGAARREEFERDYKQKVTTKRFSPFDLGPPDADEKSPQASVEDLFKIALAQDQKKEARERQNMGQEDSNSKDAVHGRRYGIRESSSCRRFLQPETELRRQAGRRAHCMIEFNLRGSVQ